jgi:2-aminoethylphosphonate-pyruvate transaminase
MARSERIILSPGPVTTSAPTKQATLRDFTPNEPDLLALTAEFRRTLVELAAAGDAYVCVPIQGTGNAANEATLGTLVPRERKLLIVNNGFYGERLKQIAAGIGVPHSALDLPITEPVGAAQLEAAFAAEPSISHLVVCHVDTGTGLLNPIEPIAELCRERGVGLIIDAIASFGGLPLDAGALAPEAIVLSPNKWLEGVPGIGLVLVRRTAIEAAAGRCHSFCLDLHRQWRGFEEHGRWRFTPPGQAIAALVAALRQHAAEGQAARASSG